MLGEHVRTRKGLALAYFKNAHQHYPGEPEEEQVPQPRPNRAIHQSAQ